MKRKLSLVGAVIIGLATLALPARASARDFDRRDARRADHDRGRHLGWFKHEHNGDERRFAAHDRRDDGDGSYAHYGQPPTSYYPRYGQPPAAYYPRYAAPYREPDRDDFACDEDRDDCEPTRGLQRPEPYLPPIVAPPLQLGPGIVSNPYLVQQRNQFASLRHDALGQYGLALRRGNRGSANYWINKVRDYDYRIAALNRLVAAQSGQAPAYGSGYSYVAGSPGYSGAYGASYGSSLDAVTATLIPMLGQALTH